MAEKSVQRAGGKTVAYEDDDYDDRYYDEDEEETGSRKALIISVSALLVALVVAMVVVLRPLLSNKGDKMVTVPSFLGQSIEEVLASELYEDFNLVEGESVYNDKYEAGKICAQSIARNESVEVGTTIELTVSKGTETMTMPDLLDRTQQKVETSLGGMGLDITYRYEEHDTVEEGRVISTEPAAGAEIKSGDKVTIILSAGSGVEMTKVPDVVDLERDDAIARLDEANLKASVTEEENSADEGRVFYQSMKAGQEVPEGTTVSIKVSKGKAEPSPSPSPTPEPTVPPSQNIAPPVTTTTPTAEPSPSQEPEPEPSVNPEDPEVPPENEIFAEN